MSAEREKENISNSGSWRDIFRIPSFSEMPLFGGKKDKEPERRLTDKEVNDVRQQYELREVLGT